MAKLTPKQEKFCQWIVKGETQADAWRKSYTVQKTTKNETVQANASRLMADSKVIARVAELRKPVIEKLQLTKEWVLNELVEIVRMGKSTELELTNNEDGEPVTAEVKQNLAAANKALELIGKELAMFVDRKEIRTGDLEAMQPEALDRFIERKMKEANSSLH